MTFVLFALLFALAGGSQLIVAGAASGVSALFTCIVVSKFVYSCMLFNQDAATGKANGLSIQTHALVVLFVLQALRTALRMTAAWGVDTAPNTATPESPCNTSVCPTTARLCSAQCLPSTIVWLLGRHCFCMTIQMSQSWAQCFCFCTSVVMF